MNRYHLILLVFIVSIGSCAAERVDITRESLSERKASMLQADENDGEYYRTLYALGEIVEVQLLLEEAWESATTDDELTILLARTCI